MANEPQFQGIDFEIDAIGQLAFQGIGFEIDAIGQLAFQGIGFEFDVSIPKIDKTVEIPFALLELSAYNPTAQGYVPFEAVDFELRTYIVPSGSEVNFNFDAFDYGTIPRIKRTGDLEGSNFVEVGTFTKYTFSNYVIEAEEFIEDPTLNVQMRLKNNDLYVKGELIEE